MALRIHCPDCRKKVSIDEAFAGGVCRCPYCKALAFVPGRMGGSGGAQGAALAQRPDTPGERSGAPRGRGASVRDAAAPVQPNHIPTASPVRFQGIVTMILLGGLLVMAAVAISLGIVYTTGRAGVRTTSPRASPTDQGASPFVPPDAPDSPEIGPTVAGIPIETPVLYVVDAGGTMRTTYDYAGALVRLSIRGLKQDEEFSLLILRQEGPQLLTEGFRPGGADGERAAKAMLEKVVLADGATHIPDALGDALEQRPRTIVLIARKSVRKTDDIILAAKHRGVRITTISLAGDAFAALTMARLAEAAGGKTRTMSNPALRDWLMRAPPVD